MYKHPSNPEETNAQPGTPPEPQPPTVMEKIQSGGMVTPAPAQITMEKLYSLLEKNLKWSQIIYEQNRRINRKLFWSAVGSWVRLLIIVVPLVLGIIFLAPVVKQYVCIWNPTQCPKGTSPADALIKSLPLNQTQQEELKAILK